MRYWGLLSPFLAILGLFNVPYSLYCPLYDDPRIVLGFLVPFHRFHCSFSFRGFGTLKACLGHVTRALQYLFRESPVTFSTEAEVAPRSE